MYYFDSPFPCHVTDCVGPWSSMLIGLNISAQIQIEKTPLDDVVIDQLLDYFDVLLTHECYRYGLDAASSNVLKMESMNVRVIRLMVSMSFLS